MPEACPTNNRHPAARRVLALHRHEHDSNARSCRKSMRDTALRLRVPSGTQGRNTAATHAQTELEMPWGPRLVVPAGTARRTMANEQAFLASLPHTEAFREMHSVECGARQPAAALYTGLSPCRFALFARLTCECAPLLRQKRERRPSDRHGRVLTHLLTD